MILWLIACIACLVLGDLKGQGKLIPWVRGAAGKARELALGVAPATTQRQANLAPHPPQSEATGEVSPTPPKNPIRPLRIAGDVWKFIWHWRYVIVALAVAFIAWRILAPVVSFVTCPFGPGILWCADKEKIDADADTRALEHEAELGHEAVDLSERTNNNIDHANRAAARGQQDIEDAIANLPPEVTEADFGNLDRVYRDAYLRVYSLRPDDTDPSARRSEPLRNPRANAA